jgi:hypothetical protein
MPPWKDMSEVRKLLTPNLLPYFFQGQMVGVKASLGGSLRLQIQRLIQSGQGGFLSNTEGSLVCDVTVGADGRGGEKVDFVFNLKKKLF